jgi:putative hydrolase of the HAD superfamily
VKYIFFDLDETLSDHQYACRQGIHAIADLHPELRTRSVEELEAEFWRRLNGNYAQVLSGALSMNDTRAERIAALFQFCGAQPPASTVTLQELSKLYVSRYDQSLRAIPGVTEVLTRLKRQNACIGVVTNGFTSIQRKKLEACGLSSFIDHLITSEQIGTAKPDPAIFRAALTVCGAKPHQAVMIGDSWVNDIEGSHAVGICTIWLNRRSEPCPDSAMAHTIHNPYELMSLLQP